jgi:hypothetical protein
LRPRAVDIDEDLWRAVGKRGEYRGECGLRAALTISSVAAASTSVPRPARSSSRIAKPPPFPIPGTEGGGSTSRTASSIALRRVRRSAVIRSAVSLWGSRSS